MWPTPNQHHHPPPRKRVYTATMSYITNIVEVTTENRNFRTVLFTGQKSQLVTMNIPVGGEIGMEEHAQVEQSIFVQRGVATVTLDGVETTLNAGSVVVVTPGTRHNVVNAGAEPLLLYTVYAPANHINGTVHATKAAADADTADEAFGAAVAG